MFLARWIWWGLSLFPFLPIVERSPLLAATYLMFAALPAWGIPRLLKRIRDAERYEFYNRTDGGVVQFATVEEAEQHASAKEGARLGFGFLAGCWLLIVAGCGWGLGNL